MVLSVTAATMIIPVPADSPPTKAISATPGQPSASGIDTMKVSALMVPSGNSSTPARATGMTNRLMATR